MHADFFCLCSSCGLGAGIWMVVAVVGRAGAGCAKDTRVQAISAEAVADSYLHVGGSFLASR